MDYKKVDLTTINSGAAIEQFEEEFQKVLENIADPNTDPEKIREVRLVLKMKPSKDRSSATTQITATSKLAPAQPHESFVVLDNDGSQINAYTTDPRQSHFDFEEKIKDFNGGAK